MQKRGAIEMAGVVLALGLLITGVIISYNIISENRYIGDNSTKTVYDLAKCKTKNISPNHITAFAIYEEAKSRGYKDAECNR